MADVICGDIQKLFYTRADDAKSAAEQVKTIMNVSFRYAVTVKVISNSPADGTCGELILIYIYGNNKGIIVYAV